MVVVVDVVVDVVDVVGMRRREKGDAVGRRQRIDQNGRPRTRRRISLPGIEKFVDDDDDDDDDDSVPWMTHFLVPF